MKKLVQKLLRLFGYILYPILKAFRIATVFIIPYGLPTLYPFSPYSERGIIRKNFKIFLKIDKETKKLNLVVKNRKKVDNGFLKLGIVNKHLILFSFYALLLVFFYVVFDLKKIFLKFLRIASVLISVVIIISQIFIG